MDTLRNKFVEMNYGVDSTATIMISEIIHCDVVPTVCRERAIDSEAT